MGGVAPSAATRNLDKGEAMTTFEEVKAANRKLRCDECKEKFGANEVVLVEAADNITILTPMIPFVYIDKDGVVKGGNEQPSKEKGDKLLTCPRCGTIHIFGFHNA